MLAVLDEIAGSLWGCARRAFEQAEADCWRQQEVNAEMAIVAAFERLEGYQDFKRGDEGQEHDMTFVMDRLVVKGNEDEKAGKWARIKMLHDHDGTRRGDIVEATESEACWMVRRGSAVWVSDSEAAAWLDQQDECFVCDVGDSLRVASLLHGA